MNMEKELLLLNKLGLTDGEAKVYLTLLRNSSITGYEASKIAGVPRSKIYNLLETLIQKGFVLYTEKESSNKYEAVPIKQVISHISKDAQNTYDEITESLRGYEHKTNLDEIWHIRNRSNILSKCKEVIASSKEEVLIQVFEEELDEILPELLELQKQEKKIGLIVFSENKNLKLPIKKFYRHGLITEKIEEMGGRYINIVSDRNEVIFGQILGESVAEVIWTKSKPMVTLAAEYIKHDMYFYKMANSFQKSMEAEYGENMEGIRDIF